MFEKSFWLRADLPAVENEYTDFTASFNASAGKKTLLYVSSETDYAVFINGKEAGYGQYADLKNYKVYDEIDITSLIAEGENRIDITAYFMRTETSGYTDKGLGLIFEITNGEKVVLSSDKTVKSRRNPYYESGNGVFLITGQLGHSYNYDFTGNGAEEYRPSVEMDEKVNLYPRPIKKLAEKKNFARIIESGEFSADGEYANSAEFMQKTKISAEKRETDLPCKEGVLLRGENVYLAADTGSECAGLLTFDIESEKDCDMFVGFGEHMTDGRVRTYIGGRNFALGFRLKKGRNVFKGYFRRLGCRYISLFAFTNHLKVYDFSVISTDYPLNVIEKSFENPLDKKIYDVSVKTLEVCMHEHYEDTPWREQALYAMDSRNQMLCGYIAFKEYAFARASLKLLSENVRKDGLFTLTSPKSTDVEQLTIPCFSLVQFCAMKEYAENSGDFSLFSEYRERYKTVLENFLSKVHKDGKIKELEGIYRWNFYEWGDDMDGNFLVPAKNRYASPLSAFLVMATDAFIYLSRKTGGYDGEYDAVKESLIRGLSEFYDCEKGVYATYIDGESGEKMHYSELANSLIIVATGVSERHNKIAEILRGKSFLQPITLSHSIYKYAALLSCGRAENEKSVLNEVRRRWGAMLDRGATTFYEDERGEAAFNDAGSLSHGWSAVPVFVYDKIFG